MLEGVDKDWIRSDNTQSVNYTLLPPGNYNFKVRCQNDQGIFCKNITSVPILIHHPYWQTWWFRCIYFTFIVAIAFLIYKMRIKQLLAVEKIRHRVARDLHDDMGSTLSTINILSMMAKNKIKVDHAKASEYIGKITDNSTRMMESMDDIIWNINPANDDMHKIIARMREFATNSIESKDIILHFSVEPSIDVVHLNTEQRRDLFLVFKEAVNNVAKYAQCTILQISLGYYDKKFYLSIIDNGIGFNVEESDNGIGIKNMQRRAYNLKGELTINSVPSTGTSIYLNFPV